MSKKTRLPAIKPTSEIVASENTARNTEIGPVGRNFRDQASIRKETPVLIATEDGAIGRPLRKSRGPAIKVPSC